MIKKHKSTKSTPGSTGNQKSIVIWILKSLLASYIITGIFLVILAVLLYKLELNEKAVSSAIIGIYVVSTLIGGMIMGKLVRRQRFLWGSGIGTLYFALLFMITFGVYHTLNDNSGQLLTTFLLCMGGGTLGGMIS